MQIAQFHVRDVGAFPGMPGVEEALGWAQWILVFGAPALLRDPRLHASLVALAPNAIMAGCSTAGEITGEGMADDSVVVTALRFEAAWVSVATTEFGGMDDSAAAGVRLGEALDKDGLRSVLFFGQGLDINGSELVTGLGSVVGPGVTITGGLAGDATRFQETLVVTRAGVSKTALVAVGLHGPALRFNHGSFGGWVPFGTRRKVTRARGSVLYELDDRPALDLYKEYLGDLAKDLPASGLLFPFAMFDSNQAPTGVIRTILSVSDVDGSLTLAGDVDPHGYLQMMHSSTDRLVSGAEAAATAAAEMAAHPGDGLGLLISCVGRRLVMGERVDEEIEAVADVFGRTTTLAGFYSYGEVSPFNPGTACKLHNQTMTVSWISEARPGAE